MIEALLFRGATIGKINSTSVKMAHILKNENVEVRIDPPTENYNFSRFDWTGKIVELKFKGRPLSGVETPDGADARVFGKGFYNEFGIDSPLGFDEAEIGGLFHKIGIGLLEKQEHQYYFHKACKVIPAEFEVATRTESIRITCETVDVNGYSYYLEKEIKLIENGFEVLYHLKNKGEKAIVTNEYNHNFLSIDRNLIGRGYVLKFPFQVKPELFGETVNPEGVVKIGQNDFKFEATPEKQFFFSNLSGGETVNAKWQLENTQSKIGISETGSFQTNKVNLWGWRHVISPELFFDIDIEAGQSMAWSRTYQVYELE